MAKEDEEKTSFTMPSRTFYYAWMAFGLKNASATFARLVYKALDSQIGRTWKLMWMTLLSRVFSHERTPPTSKRPSTTYAGDGMKVNPKKCLFRVQAGRLLGFPGIKAWDRGEPCKDPGHPRHEASPKCSRGIMLFF